MDQNDSVDKFSRFQKTLLFFIASLFLAAIVAHLHLGQVAGDAHGPLAPLDNIFALALAIGIAALALLVGRFLTSKLQIEFDNIAEELTISFFSGTGAVAFFILCMGLMGLLRSWPIVTLFTIFIALTVRHLPSLFQSVEKQFRGLVSDEDTRILKLLFLLFIGLLMFRSATPPYIADELIYHLPVPLQFVQHGRVFPSFDNSLGNVPFLIHMIYAICLMAKSDISAKLFSLMIVIATAVSLYGFCARYLTRRVGWVAMFGFFAAGMVVEVGTTTRIDVSLAGMLFVSTYAMINYLTTERIGWLGASAMLAGFSLSIKHTAGLWLILIGVMYLVETIRQRQRWVRILRSGLLYSVIALAVASPWYIKNWIWFHNPIYPFVSGEVAEFGPSGLRYFNAADEQKLDVHFAAAKAEIPDIVSAQETALTRAVNSRLARHPWRLWEFFTKPYTYLMFEPFQFPNYLFLFVPLILFVKQTKWITWLLILSLGFVFGVTLTSWIARYLLPAYPTLTIVVAYTLVNLSARLEPTFSLARRLPVYIVGIALITVVTICISSMRQLSSLSFVTGLISRHEFMDQIPEYRPIDFINSQLPPDSQVITIGAQMTYGLNLPYLSDESWYTTKWRRLLVHNDSLAGVNEELKAQGITHILYNPSLFIFAAKMGVEGTGGMNLMALSNRVTSDEARRLGPEYPILRNWSTFVLYKKQFLEQVYSDENGNQVFRIK